MAIMNNKGDTKELDPYDTNEELLAVLKPYCEKQIKDSNMTQSEADEIINKVNAQK